MPVRPRTTPIARAAGALATLGVAALISLGFGGGTAHAEKPVNMPEPIVDTAGVLTPAQRSALSDRLDRLFDDRAVQMWVVYVRDFDGLKGEDWARRSAEASNLGDHDVLLAVATDRREFYMFPPDPDSVDVSQSEFEEIEQNDVLPALKRSDWAGAGIGAADGIDAAMDPSYTGLITAGVVGGVAVVGGGGAVLYTRRRKRRRLDTELQELREQQEELTGDQLAEQPLDVLDPWSREVLTDTDNAIRTSEEELRLAVSEFGATQTQPFSDALEHAKSGLARSFTLRQRLDDNIPETTDEQRSMLVSIITTCTDVDAALDAQVAEFDAMRDLLINADARFDQITQELVALRTRLDASSTQLIALIDKHGEQTLSSVAHNVDLAREQIGFAEASADQGRAAITQPAGEQGPAVADIRSAEGAIAQATKLLDAIDNADANIAAAHSRIAALITEVDDELAEAAGLTADGGPALATAASVARTAVANARTGFDADPLGVFTALVTADADLDDALASARDASGERTRRAQVVTGALESAQAKVSAAADFIGTRRGAVQSTARTRLAEAQRLLTQANATAGTDPLDAADDARRAGSLADQALMQAQGDVVDWQQSQQPRRSDGSAAGAVLGGILVDSFLRGTLGGGRGGGFGGGFSSGGRSPGSFGGSGSSGRIGVGGRF